MADRAADLLTRPAAQSVRLLAQGYLDDATRALARLDKPKDDGALHDFRVALRRLRTTLRAYRPVLEGSLRRKLRRRLRDITDDTNRIREAEVALEWLRPLAPQLTAGERVGYRWLVKQVEQGRARDLERNVASVRRAFTAVARKLGRALVEYRQTVASDRSVAEASFASVAREAAVLQARQLDRLVAAVQAPDDATAHRARIAAKRLRYILEPLVTTLPASVDVVQRLRSLQNVLGELHDLQEFEAVVRTVAGDAAAERAIKLLEAALTAEASGDKPKTVRRRNRQPGLIAVARCIRTRREVLFDELRRGWVGTDGVWARDVEAAMPPPAAVPETVPVPVAARRPQRHARWAGPREPR